MKKRDRVKKAAKVAGKAKDAKSLVEGVLSQIDNALQTSDDSENKRFIELLNEAEEKVKQLGDKDQDWWMSEIYLRKGRCARGVLEKGKEYRLWKQAYDHALKSNNNEVIIQSGLELGFDFYEFTTSIREILGLQMSCIKSVCAQGDAIHTRLRIIGINLFNFWRQIEFRRLSEHDIKAKQFVIDGAKGLEKAGFDEDRAAPIMILLISKVFDFMNPCIEWAQLEAAVIDIPVPEHIMRKIGP